MPFKQCVMGLFFFGVAPLPAAESNPVVLSGEVKRYIDSRLSAPRCTDQTKLKKEILDLRTKIAKLLNEPMPPAELFEQERKAYEIARLKKLTDISEKHERVRRREAQKVYEEVVESCVRERVDASSRKRGS